MTSSEDTGRTNQGKHHWISYYLGDRWSRYCVIDSRGVVVKEDRVRSHPEALEETFRVVLPARS